MRNFVPAWLIGSTNHKTSNVLDHAKSEQHTAVFPGGMREVSDMPAPSYTPIVRSVMVLDDREKARMNTNLRSAL